MTYWLIVNKAAGDGRQGKSYWRSYLRAAGIEELNVHGLSETDWEQHVAPGDRVLVAGGDGSVNRVASVCVEREATLGVLPSGTANDFARNLGLPDDPLELCRMMRSEQTVEVDVSWLNGNVFLNVAHIGLGTLPSRQATQDQKQRLGRFSYLLTLAQRLGMQRGIHGRIECDDQVVEGPWLTIAIASGAYFGGGHELNQARIDDGMLDVVAIRHESWWRVGMAFITTRLLGRAPRSGDTMAHFQSSQCHIQLRHPHTVTADGENLGRMANVSAITRRGVLRVMGSRLVSGRPQPPEPIHYTPSDAPPMARPGPGAHPF
ncbi:diacylglycerol/lipid kinase family protein [Billgrantia kenyensis]|uniref:Diacylglycerol kinase family lipid kinase n=1 Tax=Billgrantia kenyensis TaxID=321266 RepID=A0A7V9W3G3_9GAMM|nr:diacylglycerol kinase family protein [Halomonas kenyensis]MBA2780260.1 diacylglycerol kinase family lipid kinase [Halomonas kenyensis]MCG6663176.1 diacylglycerol kinase family lipid kinase [Halomonas kenyensis]